MKEISINGTLKKYFGSGTIEIIKNISVNVNYN